MLKQHTPKFINYYMSMAYVSAGMSTSQRLQVGCVLVDVNNNFLSSGYNGTEPGADNCCEHVVDGIVRTNHEIVIHAEINAIDRLRERRLYGLLRGATAFITQSPCTKCAIALASGGTLQVYYLNKHKDEGGLEHLAKRKIPAIQVSSIDIPTPRLTESIKDY